MFQRFGFGRGETISDFLAFPLGILERLARLMQVIMTLLSGFATSIGGFFELLRNKATLGASTFVTAFAQFGRVSDRELSERTAQHHGDRAATVDSQFFASGAPDYRVVANRLGGINIPEARDALKTASAWRCKARAC